MAKEILSALSVAVVVAAVFFGLGRLWQYLASRWRRRTPFAERMLYPAGERFRRPLTRTRDLTTLYLAALAVAAVVFVTVYLLAPPALGRDLPDWTLFLMSVFLLLAAGGCAYQGWQLLHRRRRYQLAHDADVAVGNALERAAIRGGCVFHYVPAGKGAVIDHVIVAPHGVFAVNVTVREGLGGRVELRNRQLHFNGTPDNRPVNNAVRKAKWLGDELSRAVGNPIKARSVLVVPGWEIQSPGGKECLIVNERNIAMIFGWTRPDAYLMEDEIDRIAEYLSKSCRDANVRPPKRR